MLIVSAELIPGLLARRSINELKEYEDRASNHLAGDSSLESYHSELANRLKLIHYFASLFTGQEWRANDPAEVYTVFDDDVAGFALSSYNYRFKLSSMLSVQIRPEFVSEDSKLETPIRYKDHFQITNSRVKAGSFVGINGSITSSNIEVTGKLVVVGNVIDTNIKVDGDLMIYGRFEHISLTSKTSLYYIGSSVNRTNIDIGRDAKFLISLRGYYYSYNGSIKNIILGDNSSTLASGMCTVFPHKLHNMGTLSYACLGHPKSVRYYPSYQSTGQFYVEKGARLTFYEYWPGVNRHRSETLRSLPSVRAEADSTAFIRASAQVDTVLIRKRTTLVACINKKKKVLVS